MVLGVKATWQHLTHCTHPTLHPSISHLACYAHTPSLWVHSHIMVSPGPAVNSQYMPPPAIPYLSRHRHRDRQPATKLCSSPWSSNSSCWLNGKKHSTLSQPEKLQSERWTFSWPAIDGNSSHRVKQAVCVFLWINFLSYCVAVFFLLGSCKSLLGRLILTAHTRPLVFEAKLSFCHVREGGRWWKEVRF